MQKLCNLGVPSTSTPTLLQGITCFTWNYSKITAHTSDTCCHSLVRKRCFVFSALLLPKACRFNGCSNAEHRCLQGIWAACFMPTSGRWSRLEETGSACTPAGPLCSPGDSRAGAAAWKPSPGMQGPSRTSGVHNLPIWPAATSCYSPFSAQQKCIILFLSWTLFFTPWTCRTPWKRQRVHTAWFVPQTPHLLCCHCLSTPVTTHPKSSLQAE